MAPIRLILLVAFFICEALAAYDVNTRPNLVALGLACYAASLIF